METIMRFIGHFMKFLLLWCLLLLTLQALANPIDDKCPEHVIFGAPIVVEGDNQYLCREGYGVNYSYKTKTPIYVVERITKDELVSVVKRQNNFHEDLEIPEQYRSTLSDYSGGIWDRGHLAPAADFGYSKSAMSDSFLMSNMVPQNKTLNRGTWAYLESYVRDLAYSGDVYVITGTIYGKNYKSIGNGVGIPNSMYKIIIQPKFTKIIAYNFPNTPIDLKNFNNYRVSVKQIEKLSGVNFSPNLPNK